MKSTRAAQPKLMPSGRWLFFVWRLDRCIGFGRFAFSSTGLVRVADRSFALLLFIFFCLLGEFTLTLCKIIIWLCQLVVLSGWSLGSLDKRGIAPSNSWL